MEDKNKEQVREIVESNFLSEKSNKEEMERLKSSTKFLTTIAILLSIFFGAYLHNFAVNIEDTGVIGWILMIIFAVANLFMLITTRALLDTTLEVAEVSGGLEGVKKAKKIIEDINAEYKED